MTTQSDRYQDDIMLPQLGCDWHQAGHKLAIVFVTSTWGSSPRPVGSMMLVRDDMRIEGSVSGGCIEGAVIEAALDAMKSGTGQPLSFGVADETAWEVGLSCGGSIEVLVIPVGPSGMSFDILTALADAARLRQPLQLSISLATATVTRATEISVMQSGMQSVMQSGGATGPEIYTHLQEPRLQLVIVGAVHIAQYLAPMAQSCGFEVTLIDPRGIFAHPERFASSTVKDVWPSDILPQMMLDARTAFVTLTHDPKIDDDALRIALQKPVFYLACLGSRKTHEKRCARLRDDATDEALQRISAPAGLDIGSRSPAEIAVSIMAEMIAAWHGPKRQIP